MIDLATLHQNSNGWTLVIEPQEDEEVEQSVVYGCDGEKDEWLERCEKARLLLLDIVELIGMQPNKHKAYNLSIELIKNEETETIVSKRNTTKRTI